MMYLNKPFARRQGTWLTVWMMTVPTMSWKVQRVEGMPVIFQELDWLGSLFGNVVGIIQDDNS